MSRQDDQRTSDEIENEIHQTRARLDETLHEIEERFSPQKLMNTTYDYLRHGGAEDAISSIGRTIRENPLPVMVTGIGLGWLLLAQRSSHHDHEPGAIPLQGGYPGATLPRTRMPDGDDMPGSGGYDTVSGAGTTTLGHDPAALGATPQHGEEHGHGSGMTRKAQQMASDLKGRAQQMGSQARDRAQHVSDQMRERAQDVSGQMRERSSHLRERQHSAMQSVSHRARDAGSQSTHFVQDHPLVAGALGIAVGAVLGSLFSPTRAENRHLGDIRDRAMHRAEEAGQEQLERAEEKIHETAERVKEEARSAQSSSAPSSNASPSNASSSNAPRYVENPSSEERFAKAGSTPTQSGNSQQSGSEAAKKGGANAPSSKPPSGSSTPAKGG